jgi:FkbM family methyltransferase
MFIPEGSFKNFLRKIILRKYPLIPRELMVNRGNTVVMVGTAKSIRIVRISKSVGKNGKVVIIEPDTQNLESHWECVRTNSLDNVKIVEKAAFSNKGKGVLLVAPKAADHKLVIEGIEHDNDYRSDQYYISSVDVDVDTVDNIVRDAELEVIDYIEIAVNGGELAVLEGMGESLSRTNRIFVKGHARDKETKRPIHERVIPILEGRGFLTHLTRPSRTIARTIDWGPRAGDVYGWKR